MKSRQTKQKELLHKELDTFTTFFTADDLFNKINDKNLGIATVYRFLKDLKNQHKLHSYVCDRKTIYSKDSHNHSHFICEKCGRVTHFNIDNIDFLKKKIKGSICHFQIDVSGVCERCK